MNVLFFFSKLKFLSVYIIISLRDFVGRGKNRRRSSFTGDGAPVMPFVVGMHGKSRVLPPSLLLQKKVELQP